MYDSDHGKRSGPLTEDGDGDGGQWCLNAMMKMMAMENENAIGDDGAGVGDGSDFSDLPPKRLWLACSVWHQVKVPVLYTRW